MICSLYACKNDTKCISFSSVKLCAADFKLKKTENLIEGQIKFLQIDNIELSVKESYYANNLYEPDVEVVSPSDSLQIELLSREGVPFVISESRSEIDLDYYRKYNVYFDTINGLGIKKLVPRVPYTETYKCFIAKLPNSYKEGIGYKSLTIECDNVKTEKDLETLNEFIESITPITKACNPNQ